MKSGVLSTLSSSFQNSDGIGIKKPHNNGWAMHSVQHWGERPHGPWTLTLNDNRANRHIKAQRYLLSWKLEIFGTDHPVPQERVSKVISQPD